MELHSVGSGPDPMWPGAALLIVVLGIHSLWLLACSFVPIVQGFRPEKRMFSPAHREELARWILVAQMVLFTASLLAWVGWDAFAAKMWPGPDWEYETSLAPTLSIFGSFFVQLASIAAWHFVRSRSRLQAESLSAASEREPRGRWAAAILIATTTLLPICFGINGSYFLGERRDVGFAVMGLWLVSVIACAAVGSASYGWRRGNRLIGPVVRWMAFGLVGFPFLYIGWAIFQDRVLAEGARGYCNRVIAGIGEFRAAKGHFPKSTDEIGLPNTLVPTYPPWPIEFRRGVPEIAFTGGIHSPQWYLFDWENMRWRRYETGFW